MPSLDLDKLSDFVEEWWDKSALPSLCEFVEIPALSPSFDSDWEANGYLDAAVNTFIAWTRSLPLKGLTVSVHRLKNRSPLLLVKVFAPTAVFCAPVVFEAKAPQPIAVLTMAVVFDPNAL